MTATIMLRSSASTISPMCSTWVRAFSSAALPGRLSSPTSQLDWYPSGHSSRVPRATLIPGQGIGKEVTQSMLSVFEAAKVPIKWDRFDIDDLSDNFPVDAKNSVLATGVAVKGPFFTPTDSPKRSMNIIIRTTLDLFANVVHVFNIPGLESRHKNVDIVTIRENTEGEYSGLEHEVVPGVVESLKIISADKSYRIAEYAFQYAIRNGRKKVTAVHKANIMKAADGLFLKCCTEVASKYPSIQFEGMIVDNTCMQLASKPQQFDVMVMPNLYGNIVTNISTGLVGGPGLFPGMNVGTNGAMFEQGARHAAVELAGKNVANPTATILASCMMLRHLNMNSHADKIETAVMGVYASRNMAFRTRDTGGTASTTDFVKAVVEHLKMAHA